MCDSSNTKSGRTDGESLKVFPGKGQQRQKSVLQDPDTSFSTDPDLSVSTPTLGRPDAVIKKDDDEWNWSDGGDVAPDDVGLDKPASTVDVLANLTADDDKIGDDDEDIAGMEKDDGCMLIEMTGNDDEEDGRFVIVSPQSGALENPGKVGGLGGAAAAVHKCKVCNRQFARKQSLVRHEKMHHVGSAATAAVGEYSCSMCGESFAQRTHLDNHMAMKHVNQPATR